MEYLREGRLIVTDSREVVPGSIFVALGGKKSDGHAYVLEAQKKGAVLALVGPQFLRPPELTIQTLRVTDPLYALQELAKLKRRLFAGFVIGITGSFGKTLVKDMLATLLGKSCVASPESYNSQLGVALSLLAMPLHAEFYVLELGVSQPGEMDRLIEMLAPDASIIVSIGDEHIEHFGSVQAIEREKRKILTPYLKWSLIPQSRTQAQIDIQTAMLHFEQSVPIRLFAPYHHYARCVELAIEAALLCNVTADCIVERILDFIPQNLALHLFRKEGVLLCVQPQGLKTLSYHRNERLATLFCARAAKELSHADNRLYVDLNAIASNISLLQKKCPIIASIKANAYGTDAVVMARFLRSCGVSAFLVAHLDEALELRQAGIEESILLLHCPQKHLEELLDANIEPFIGEKEDLAALSFLAQKKKINANVHLQIDTGMMRLGVKPIDAPGLAAYIKTLPNICLKGLCGHFAAADASEHDAFTGEQMQIFKRLSRDIQSPWVHLSNSAGLLRNFFMGTHARIGLALYGILPCQSEVFLRPALSLRSSIIRLAWGYRGETVSYGRRYTVEKERELIATVPMGYFDGLHRSYGGRAHALVRGVLAPFVGSVCMDFHMLNVTDVPHVRLGDEVTYFGKDDFGKEIAAEAFAKEGGSIAHELMTTIGPRVQRVFLLRP